MRMEEEFVGKKLQFAELLKKVANQIETDQFLIRGREIKMSDEDMEFKISHKSDFGMHKLSISIEWLEQ
ncbi:hypothetical protein [Gottfriedia acidiceleris]|uniref:hypothetical protein n=1 Tax=Gottfriedia acidiceleris TaxID=371036 RepID=UPI003D21EF0E